MSCYWEPRCQIPEYEYGRACANLWIAVISRVECLQYGALNNCNIVYFLSSEDKLLSSLGIVVVTIERRTGHDLENPIRSGYIHSRSLHSQKMCKRQTCLTHVTSILWRTQKSRQTHQTESKRSYRGWSEQLEGAVGSRSWSPFPPALRYTDMTESWVLALVAVTLYTSSTHMTVILYKYIATRHRWVAYASSTLSRPLKRDVSCYLSKMG